MNGLLSWTGVIILQKIYRVTYDNNYALLLYDNNSYEINTWWLINNGRCFHKKKLDLKLKLYVYRIRKRIYEDLFVSIIKIIQKFLPVFPISSLKGLKKHW